MEELISKFDDSTWNEVISNISEQYKDEIIDRLCKADLYHYSSMSMSEDVNGNKGSAEYCCHNCCKILKIRYEISNAKVDGSIKGELRSY